MKLFKYWENRLRRVTSSGNYIPEIDGLRFLAIMPVLIQHLSERLLRYSPTELYGSNDSVGVAYLASRGTIGVYLFFVISGFILGLPFARQAKNHKPRISLGKYFGRRITRLEPPYILWMLCFTLVLWVRSDFLFPGLGTHLWASLFYVHSLVFNQYSIINPVAWSLEVEIQFYLAAPFLAWFFFRKIKQYRSVFLLGSIVLIILGQNYFGLGVMPWKASLLNHLQYFLIGFYLVHLHLEGKMKLASKSKLLWDLLSLLAIVGLIFSWSDEWAKELVFNLCLGLLILGAFKGGVFSRLMNLSWISLIGGMCYTIYLIHLPLLELLTQTTANWVISSHYGWQLLWQMTLCIPIVLMLSAAAFLYLEKPFMNPNWPADLKNKLKNLNLKNMTPPKRYSRKSGMRKLLLILPLLLFGQLIFGQEQLPTSNNPNSPNDLNSIHLQPLAALISAALHNAPLLKGQEHIIANKTAERSIAKKEWMNNLQFAGNFMMNNGLYADEIESFSANSFLLSNRRNMVYNVGLVLKIPLGDVATRSKRLQVKSNEIEIELLRKNEQEALIRKTVIELYQQVSLQINLLRIRAEDLENSRLSARLAEEYFRENAIDLEIYSQNMTKKTRSEEAFAQTRSDLSLGILLLKEWCGTEVLVQ